MEGENMKTNMKKNRRSNVKVSLKKNVTQLLLASTFLVGSLGLTGCSKEDFAFGAGVIVGVIISDDGTPVRPGPGRPAPYPGHHHDHYDRRGPVRPGPYYSELNFDTSMNTESVADLTSVESTVVSENEKAAQHLNLNLEQAAIVMGALRSAQNRDLSKVQDLGFTEADFIQMSKGENPSATALKTISVKLGLDLGSSHELIQTLKSDLALGLSRYQ
jgi:hypothetical protein